MKTGFRIAYFAISFLIFTLFIFLLSGCTERQITLSNAAGVEYRLQKNADGWALGTLSYNGKPIESPLNEGVFFLKNSKDQSIRQVAASKAKRIDNRTVELSGQTEVDGVIFTFQMKVALDENLPVVSFTPAWKVDKDLPDWEVGFTYHGNNFANDWRVQFYPFAGNSEEVSAKPLRYCGVPGALIYKPDLSTVVLFTIDSRSDYLNPTTWTGNTGFAFSNGKEAPAFYAGSGGKLTAGIDYELPLQLILNDSGTFTSSITNIMQTWMKVSDYKVDTSLNVRTPQEAFDIIVQSRPQADYWMPGMGYEHHRGTPFIYVANNYIAYAEYKLYTITGEKVFRDRAFTQLDFLLKGQQPNGAFHTSYYFKPQKRNYDGPNMKHHVPAPPEVADGFCSWCWGHNGYKVDINAYASRFVLQTWQLLKEHEGIDRKDWYDAAIKSLDWILAQQNEDGGFPQCVDIRNGEKSMSVVSARTMVALPHIAKITGDEKYLKKALEAEKFLREKVENRFWFTGMHPDLPPEDYEQDSFWAIVEYWLDKHERTGEQEALEHAVANTYLALLSWCPKQLSWVKNPTQGTSSEQQHYGQYSVYSYGNRKLQCLDRLSKNTNDPLFSQLFKRTIQNQFYTQITEGKYKGSMYEAISDPWLERGHGFDYMNSPYTSELVMDLVLQLVEMDLVKGK
ncbi:MAG: hypothetical protein LBN71_01455 [Tannerella sp.]|jgi:hypothetical protein|nr:hypothetical protein [Tannerella sp.]